MACETIIRRKQTRQQRIAEVKKVIETVDKRLANGKVKAVVDKKTGAIAFAGLEASERDDVSDACIYRKVMQSGSTAAKLAIAKAEQLAGRTVSQTALGHGVHSHDGGITFHPGH